MASTALFCVAALGVLVFGMGLVISGTRKRTGQMSGANPDPEDYLYRLVRAHGNTTEYAPFLAVLMLYLGSRTPETWVIWTMVVATVCRYVFVVGLVLYPTMARPNLARFTGAAGTYICGLALCFAALQTI